MPPASLPYAVAPGVSYAAAPTMSVETPGQTVTMSSSAPAVASVSGLETMKIVAGPGKGKFVSVNAGGKIVGATTPLATSPLATWMGPRPNKPVQAPFGAPMATMAPMAPMGMGMATLAPMALMGMGAVIETPYARLSGKDQATVSPSTAATAADTAQNARALASGQSDEAHDEAENEEAAVADVSRDSEAAATGEDAGEDGVAPSADSVPADADEGDTEKVAVRGQLGAILAPLKHLTPQLALNTPTAHHHSEHDEKEDEDPDTEARERRRSARRADAYSDMTGGIKNEVYDRPQVLVRVPHGKRPGDFFSAEVAGRGLMLVEVPEAVRGGDDLQLLQMPTDNGEELEWIKYQPTSSLTEARQIASRHLPQTGDGLSQDDMDSQFATRDSVRNAWSLGQRAPRSYFH